MLLAFSAKPEELDILMLSLTFGNVEVQKYVSQFATFGSPPALAPFHSLFDNGVTNHFEDSRTDYGLNIVA
jgi:hypothetical protein